jgi:hypothetical protein
MGHTTNVTNAAVATAITVWGIATGLTYEVLLAGFAGGLVSLSFLGPLTIWQRIWTPFAATLTAGYTSPIWAYYLLKWLDRDMPALPLLVFSAFCIGLAAQVLIPVGLEWVRRKGATYEGPSI